MCPVSTALIGSAQKRVIGTLMTPAIDASSSKPKLRLSLWELKYVALRPSRLCLGQTQTTEKTKFSSFCRFGPQAQGPGLLLWGQVKAAQIAGAADNHSSHFSNSSTLYTPCTAGKFCLEGERV